MKSISSKIISIMLIASMCFGLVACGSSAPAENAEPEAAATEAAPVVEEAAPAPAVEENSGDLQILEYDGTRSYLTGLPTDKELVAKRPISIMIENTSDCLPHYNLDKAGFIYECPTEGNITRYMAIYDDWKDLDRIGNVRSCRTYYIYFSAEYEAIYFHYGQSPFAIPYLEQNIVDDVNGVYGEGTVAFWRSSDRSAPHNAYASADSIVAGIEYKNIDTDFATPYEGHWQFAADGCEVTLEDGEDVQVIVPYYFYNTPWFIYNEEDGLYYRYEFGNPEVDAVSGKQYAVKNVIFQDAPNDMYMDGPNTPSKYVQFYITHTGGSGKYFTNGKMIDVTWEKENDGDPTKFYDMDGNEIVLNQGVTWYCLIQTAYAEENRFYATEEEWKAAK